jgi:anti-sigma B factor antagonist
MPVTIGVEGRHGQAAAAAPDERQSMLALVEKVGNVTVVVVNVVDLDANVADDFRKELAPVLKDCRKLVLDLQRVQFVDSRGCGAIISCLKQLSTVAGDLKLCQVSQPVRAVFELIRLNRICEIVDTRQDAVRAFQE